MYENHCVFKERRKNCFNPTKNADQLINKSFDLEINQPVNLNHIYAPLGISNRPVPRETGYT